jgi:hypothetical protein
VGLDEDGDEGFDCGDRHGEFGVFAQEAVVGFYDAVEG